MKYTALIIGLGLLTASVFGFASMAHAVTMNCDPSSPTSTCPPSQLGMAFHHISDYGNFLLAIVSPTMTSVISILLALVFAFVLVRFALLKQILSLSRRQSREENDSNLSQYKKLTRWLALLETNPAV